MPDANRTYSLVVDGEFLLAFVSHVGVNGVTWCRLTGTGALDESTYRTESLADWEAHEPVMLSYPERMAARLAARAAVEAQTEFELRS